MSATVLPEAVASTSDVGDTERPDVAHDAYATMKPRWEKCRALMLGVEAIRAGGETYLSKLEGESDASYAFRQTLCALHNGFQRTVLASVGFLLERPPELGEDMDQPLVDFAENVDRAGTHLNVFTQKLATAGMVDGYAGIMVEHTRVANPDQLSGDEEKRLGIGPYWLLYKIDDVIKPLYEVVNGVRTLVLLVLRETVRKRAGKFGRKIVTQYRIYTNENGVVRYELWEQRAGGVPQQITQPTALVNQTEIPWSPLPAGQEVTVGEYKPPLLDLADLNIEHHQCKTNIRALETLACVPTQVRIGATPDANGVYAPIVLGPRSTIEAPYQQGVAQPIYWHSPDIAVLAPAQDSLTKVEAAMGAAGMAFLAPDTRAAETAQARRIDTAAQRATLATVAQTTQDCLERAFGFTAKYLQVAAGSVAVNTDFTGEGVNPALLSVMVQAYQQDALTLEELRAVIQTGKLPETFDAQDVVALLARVDARADQNAIDAQNAPASEMVVKNPDGSPRFSVTRRSTQPAKRTA